MSVKSNLGFLNNKFGLCDGLLLQVKDRFKKSFKFNLTDALRISHCLFTLCWENIITLKTSSTRVWLRDDWSAVHISQWEPSGAVLWRLITCQWCWWRVVCGYGASCCFVMLMVSPQASQQWQPVLGDLEILMHPDDDFGAVKTTPYSCWSCLCILLSNWCYYALQISVAIVNGIQIYM